MQNLINNKIYIGQTNNFKVRMNNHKSDAFNKKSSSYNSPLSSAIRKYGWENFQNNIIEEIPESNEDWKITDQKEKYYIEYYCSLSNQNGYNISLGGQGCPKRPLTYEEKLRQSRIFSKNEIKDIQRMLREGEQSFVIREKYYPRLSHSYIDNINNGVNFYNEEWKYPLNKFLERSKYFTSQEIKQIKNDIRKDMSYKEIAEKWNISIGFISSINNGKSWYNKNEKYPLCTKNHSRLHNKIWVEAIQNDLINTNLPMTKIAQKYNKAYSTVKKINSGFSHKNNNFKYPLTSNRK